MKSVLINLLSFNAGWAASVAGAAPLIGMRWLRKSVFVAVIAGAVGGPLAFLAGERMGAVSFNDPLTSLVVIGVGWAVLLPVLVKIAARFDGHPVQGMHVEKYAEGCAP